VSAKVFFWLVFILAALGFIVAAIPNFEKFLEVTVPALVFVTGICWALRTVNVHQYEVTERNMETYIYLYDATGSEMKEGYRRSIESCNQHAREDLPGAVIFSYMTLYISFSAIFLFAAEMVVVVYRGYSLAQNVWWVWCILGILSWLFFIPALVSLGLRLLSKSRDEFKPFRRFSQWLVDKTYILKEDWIKFYRKEDWRELYRKIIEVEAGGVIEKRGELSKEFTPSDEQLERVIWKYDWLVDLLRSDETC
jgi:hypothetical protein